MTIRVVRLGGPRQIGEGIRLGTVRRPPRGVPKAEFASRDFYDVWLPDLAPSEDLLKLGQASVGDERSWGTFVKRYRRGAARCTGCAARIAREGVHRPPSRCAALTYPSVLV